MRSYFYFFAFSAFTAWICPNFLDIQNDYLVVNFKYIFNSFLSCSDQYNAVILTCCAVRCEGERWSVIRPDIDFGPKTFVMRKPSTEKRATLTQGVDWLCICRCCCSRIRFWAQTRKLQLQLLLHAMLARRPSSGIDHLISLTSRASSGCSSRATSLCWQRSLPACHWHTFQYMCIIFCFYMLENTTQVFRV